MGVNAAFIVALTKVSGYEVQLASFALALFKLAWNSFFLVELLNQVDRQELNQTAMETLIEQTIMQSSLVVFNTVVIPCIGEVSA